MIWRVSAGVSDAANERSATININRTATFMDFLLSASADELRNVERHRGEASWCGAGARTRRKLRQSSGGWGRNSIQSDGTRFSAAIHAISQVFRAWHRVGGT